MDKDQQKDKDVEAKEFTLPVMPVRRSFDDHSSVSVKIDDTLQNKIDHINDRVDMLDKMINDGFWNFIDGDATEDADKAMESKLEMLEENDNKEEHRPVDTDGNK